MVSEPEAVSIQAASCCTPAKPVAFGGACCTTEEKTAAIDAGASCRPPAESKTPELITRLAELTRRHDINAYAASVNVFAVKPR